MAQSFKSIVVEAGSFKNVPFLERDARNHVDKVRRLRLEEGDAAAFHNILRKCKQKMMDFSSVLT